MDGFRQHALTIPRDWNGQVAKDHTLGSVNKRLFGLFGFSRKSQSLRLQYAHSCSLRQLMQRFSCSSTTEKGVYKVYETGLSYF